MKDACIRFVLLGYVPSGKGPSPQGRETDRIQESAEKPATIVFAAMGAGPQGGDELLEQPLMLKLGFMHIAG
jgi:hypothetical protein